MNRIRAFTSFDFDHDEDLRNLLVGQAKNPDSPFEIADWSLRQAFSGDWQDKVRHRLRCVDQVIVLCGEHTDKATGVNVELHIAREEKKSYFLLAGRANGKWRKPSAALPTDKVYNWTWDNLKRLIHGSR